MADPIKADSLTVVGEFELSFQVTVHDRAALHGYMALYPEQWTDERQIIKAFIWQSYNYNERRDPAGTDGFADLPVGIVSIDWSPPTAVDIFDGGEWW